MLNIMKMFKIFLIMVVGSIMMSCYNDFKTPSPEPIYNEDVMKAMGLQHISIYDLKKLFGEISGTGSTNVSDGLSATMYKRFVTNKSQATTWEQQTNRYIVGNYYIKGKVISSDKEGNIYKSLYIYDNTAAIELKLTNDLYIEYQFDMNTLESQWVYVKLAGLYMGNFRMMLSIGDIPTEGMNSYGRPKFYPNSNIVSPEKVKKHVFKGPKVTLTKGRLANDGSNKNAFDILEIDKDNCSQLLYKNSDKGINYFGRLMEFKNVEMIYKGVPNHEGEVDSDRFDDDLDSDTGYYPAWICTSGMMKDTDGSALVSEFIDGPWGKMAYSENNVSLYGQMLVGYNRNASAKNVAGTYVVRTSGYSKYASQYVPMDGAKGTMLAIYSIYSKQVNTSGSSYEAYQLSPCRFQDILPEYYGAEDYAEKEAKVAQWAKPVSEGGMIPDSSFTRPASLNEDEGEE